jgi:uncharacterized membrane protein YfcA
MYSGIAAALGATGGLGGAVLLVPVLLARGIAPADAAPFGLMSVAAGSIAAAPTQLRDRSVNHRLGISVEFIAAIGTVIGALNVGALSDTAVVIGLMAVVVIAIAVGLRHRDEPELEPTGVESTGADSVGASEITAHRVTGSSSAIAVGERIGSLDGAYPSAGGVVPYHARRVPVGLGLMSVAGLVAGVSGVSAGFLKTAVMTEVMAVPVKVAAATTTFTVGITASTGLLIFVARGEIDPTACGAVIAASILGGRLGALIQGSLSPRSVKRVSLTLLCAVLFALASRIS